MKKHLLIFALLATTFSFAQTEEEVFSSMVEAEMKAASNTMSFAANANTQNYDITYHKLEFTVNPANYFISGVVTTDFIAKQNMNTITFDLTNELTVSSVKQGNTTLTFTQNANDELVITLPSTLATGAASSVKITYSGAPSGENAAFTTSSHSGTPILWTLSEPYGAKDWWPNFQVLGQKADTTEMIITTPPAYYAGGMGLLTGIDSSGSDWTHHWQHNYPCPPYLVGTAVSNYWVYDQKIPVNNGLDSIAVLNYLYAEDSFVPIA